MNVVHIGFERTGNTTLQNSIYARQDKFIYIGARNDLYPDRLTGELFTRISSQDSLAYDAGRTKALLQSMRQGSDKRVLVATELFSLEGGADRRLIAKRLHDLFAPAKALLLIRAQTTLVQAQYLKQLGGLDGRVTSFPEWLDSNYGDIVFSAPYRVGLDYEPLIQTYEEVFGADNLVVLPSELMHEENSLFQRNLASLLHIPLPEIVETLRVNVTDQRISRRHVLAHRIQDMLPPGTNLALLGRRLLPQPIYEPIRRFIEGGSRLGAPELPDEWRQRIAKMCGASNARLEARRKLPLAALGYPTVNAD
jgi:hypothetical protein